MPKQDGNQNSKSWLRWATFASFVKLYHMSSQSPNISGKADLRRSPAAVGGNCCPLPPLVTPLNSLMYVRKGGSVAEWSACWTQAQKSPGSNRSRDAVR